MRWTDVAAEDADQLTRSDSPADGGAGGIADTGNRREQVGRAIQPGNIIVVAQQMHVPLRIERDRLPREARWEQRGERRGGSGRVQLREEIGAAVESAGGQRIVLRFGTARDIGVALRVDSDPSPDFLAAAAKDR